MGHFRSNLRDMTFNLFEVFGIGELLGNGRFADLDEETARDILSEVANLAEGPVADSFADGDRNPPVFSATTHTVTIPESVKRSYQAWMDAEFWRVGLPAELGGQDAPEALHWAIAELVLGANPSVFLYTTCGPFATVLWQNGNVEQKHWARLMVEQGWGSTMVLTEPEAGSDVGAGRTKAVQQADGSWHIEGVKRFITSAVNDMVDNVIHLVLARPEGHGPGTKGLALFVVPEWLFDSNTGELGARNGVFVTNIEHKMGLKASTTCELRFGEVDGIAAKGWLVGDAHDGIAQMFQVVEHARMLVGAKAMATLSTAYLNALEYAKVRVQSTDLTRSADKSAQRVTIIHHPDVRRSLMLTKAYAEGFRALVCYTARVEDKAVKNILLPIVKGATSERCCDQLSQALQIFGGSGYMQDYPLEQYIRDAKIDTIYEGTTGIQGQDLFFRKILKDRGKSFAVLLAEIGQFVESIADEGRLKVESEALSGAVADLDLMIQAMCDEAARASEDVHNLYKVGQNTTRLLLAAGDVMVGYLLLRQAAVALKRLDEGDVAVADRVFYEGKLAAAHFFAMTVIPQVAAARTVVQNIDNNLMDVPEAAF